MAINPVKINSITCVVVYHCVAPTPLACITSATIIFCRVDFLKVTGVVESNYHF